MKLKLVKLMPEYRTQLEDMLGEWYASGEKIVPYSIRRLDYRDFDRYLKELDIKEGNEEGCVPDSTFFCLDEQRYWIRVKSLSEKIKE